MGTMSIFLDEPETLEAAEQHAFNLAVWEKVLKDDFLRELPHRIETDELGRIIMLPPPAPEHGRGQFNIGFLLKTWMKGGEIITECPISTSDGVKGADTVWISEERWAPQRGQVCLTRAPEICVEVVSPDNSRREMKKKKRLYFEAGAEEVWFRERDGRMVFFRKNATEVEAKRSALCPKFPARVD